MTGWLDGSTAMRWTVVVAGLSAGGAISLRDLIYAMRSHIAHLSELGFGDSRERGWLEDGDLPIISSAPHQRSD